MADTLKLNKGCGVVGKVAVFGLLKRNSKVYTLAVHNTHTASLLSIIRDPVKYDVITHTDVIKAMMCYMSVSLATSTSNTVHILSKGKTTLRTFETR